MKRILILENNEERIAAFQCAVAGLGPDYELKIWRDALSMRKESEALFTTAALISITSDLTPSSEAVSNPGSGLDAAMFLGDFLPVCPVIIHSGNTDRIYSLENELRFSGWIVDHVVPVGARWIEHAWLDRARSLFAEHPNRWKCSLPTDHAERVERMMLSLNGLAIGDALGEMFCYRSENAPARLRQNDLPAGPWFHTDDTEMAISVAAVLKSHGRVDGEALSKRFARRFERDPDRGYGKMTRIQLREILAGAKWQVMANNAFGG